MKTVGIAEGKRYFGKLLERAKRWPHLPHLSPAEAAAFERELASARRRLSAGKSAPR